MQYRCAGWPRARCEQRCTTQRTSLSWRGSSRTPTRTSRALCALFSTLPCIVLFLVPTAFERVVVVITVCRAQHRLARSRALCACVHAGLFRVCRAQHRTLKSIACFCSPWVVPVASHAHSVLPTHTLLTRALVFSYAQVRQARAHPRADQSSSGSSAACAHRRSTRS
jgi:hypothetical protein